MKQTSHDDKKNSKILFKAIVPIVGALIGAAAVIIGAIIAYSAFNYFLIEIRIYNEKREPIEALLWITGDSEKYSLDRRTDREGRLELNKLKNGEYKILASADGYDPARAEFDQHDKQVNITMKKTVLVTGPTPFPIAGWGAWAISV
jgi:hypothetical protein